MPDLDALQARLGYVFRDTGLLRLALTHPSVVHETGVAVLHNQRLEFLGDAVLGLVLTRALYEKFPAFDEGPLTKARAQMVNRHALVAEALRIGLGQHLILSRGEEANGGRERPSILADGFEALMGALFLDGGYEVARAWILRYFHDRFSALTDNPSIHNPKGELQEILQADSSNAPEYRVESASGPDHERHFECTVHHGGVELGRGQGQSKKMAESRAALAALATLKQKAGEITVPPDAN